MSKSKTPAFPNHSHQTWAAIRSVQAEFAQCSQRFHETIADLDEQKAAGQAADPCAAKEAYHAALLAEIQSVEASLQAQGC